MANWSELKASIASAIKANGNQEITGALLQNVLNSVVSSAGENATFAGVATPATNPGTPDGPVFYIASESGIYPNFSGIELENNEWAVLSTTSDGTWNKQSMPNTSIVQELGNSDEAVISQKCSAIIANPRFITNSAKFNPYIMELYISGTYKGIPASEAGLYIKRAGCQVENDGKNTLFLYITSINNPDASTVIACQTSATAENYHKVTADGLTLEFISRLFESPYNWNSATDTIEASMLTARAFDINYSPTIKAIALNSRIDALNESAYYFTFAKDTNDIRVARFIKELYISGPSDLSGTTFTIKRLFTYAANKVDTVCGISISASDGNSYYFVFSENEIFSGYARKVGDNGVTFEFIVDFTGNTYNYMNASETIINNTFAFDINYSPAIKAIREQQNSSVHEQQGSVLQGKKVYFIGDSIIAGQENVPTVLSLTHFLSEKYGADCFNKARGGAVLTSSPLHYAPIYSMLTSIPDDADYIIMQGGLNGMAKDATEAAPWGWGDISDSYETDFNTVLQIPCLEAMCKYVATNFPTKKFGFIINYKISSDDYWTEKAALIKQVLEKWGIPYIDWRQSGVNLASEAIREQYGVDAFANYPNYSSSNTYKADDCVIYNSKAYKAKQDITVAESWNPAHWDVISGTRYDGWHCNAKAYQQLADKTAAWMSSL